MKRIIRLTESDLARIVRRVINEENDPIADLTECFKDFTPPSSCSRGEINTCIDDLKKKIPQSGESASKALACVIKKSKNLKTSISIPGYGGGQITLP